MSSVVGRMDLVSIFYPLILKLVTIFRILKRSLYTVGYPIVKRLVVQRFAAAGLELNGKKPEDIQIRPGSEKEVILRIACDGELGLGETYMAGMSENIQSPGDGMPYALC